MSKNEMIREARTAIEAAKRKHHRWLLWEQITDQWECEVSEDEARFQERLRVAKFIADNQDTLREFAGDRTGEMIAFMLREMKATEVEA